MPRTSSDLPDLCGCHGFMLSFRVVLQRVCAAQEERKYGTGLKLGKSPPLHCNIYDPKTGQFICFLPPGVTKAASVQQGPRFVKLGAADIDSCTNTST